MFFQQHHLDQLRMQLLCRKGEPYRSEQKSRLVFLHVYNENESNAYRMNDWPQESNLYYMGTLKFSLAFSLNKSNIVKNSSGNWKQVLRRRTLGSNMSLSKKAPKISEYKRK